MPNTLYNAINGQEAKDIIKLALAEFIDKHIPLLKRGNTFHLFRCRLRLDVFAVPEDVPTPKDVEFDFEKLAIKFEDIAKGLSEDAVDRLRKDFFQRKDNLNNLLELKQEIDSYLERYYPTLLSADKTIDDKGIPDNIRMRYGMPLHELELEKNLNRRSEMPVNYKPVDMNEGNMIE